MKSKEQIAAKNEIKRAKRDFRETIQANPEGFQTERIKMQSYAIDIKTKTKAGSRYEIEQSERSISNTFEGRTQESTFVFDHYRGNYNLGYTCKLIIGL